MEPSTDVPWGIWDRNWPMAYVIFEESWLFSMAGFLWNSEGTNATSGTFQR